MGSISPFPTDVRTTKLPRISLAKLKDGDATEGDRLFEACIDTGCFLLDLTAADSDENFQSNIDKAFTIGKSFFDEPLELKSKFHMDERNIGYKPTNIFSLPNSIPDTLEIFGASADRLLSPSPSPHLPPNFLSHRPFLSTLVTAHLHPICTLILETIALRLELDPATFEALHSPSQPSATILRFLRYNPASTSAQTPNPDPPEEEVKLLGHTDNGSLTILFPGPVGGLQILPPSAEAEDEGEWEYVAPERGCAFVNVGDSLVKWTGGVLRSVFHRVVDPPGAQKGARRESWGYFLKPDDGAIMRGLKEGLLQGAGEEEEGKAMRYEDWHKAKSKNIVRGENGVGRGGTRRVKWRRRGGGLKV